MQQLTGFVSRFSFFEPIVQDSNSFNLDVLLSILATLNSAGDYADG